MVVEAKSAVSLQESSEAKNIYTYRQIKKQLALNMIRYDGNLIYSLAYLSDNICGCHLDDVVPKEFLVCGLLTTLRCLLTRLS